MTTLRVPYSTERIIQLIAESHIRASLEASAGYAVKRSGFCEKWEAASKLA